MKPGAGRVATAALLPPFAVYRADGAGRPFALACGLTVLGFVPGAAFALWRTFHPR